MNERSIFLEALDKADPTQRSAYLDTACAGDDALRQQVEALLKSHADAGNFMVKLVPERIAEELAVQETAGKTQGETPAGEQGDEELRFLAPSDKPGVLGQLCHYDIQGIIGRGGMGIVLRAFDERLHRMVAIKVMAPRLATSVTARKRFVREAQAAAAVRNEHVIDIYAVDEAQGLPYLAMEYIAGVSLQERLDQSGPLGLKQILRIGMQAAVGLAAAHTQGLIHRDVKPSNILLEDGVERVRLTDFGLARAVDDASLTQSGSVAGTPQYMSPEQAGGEVVDQRSDLFSLGSVLYAMCTGHAPFRASGSMAVLKRVCEETPTPIREINSEIPDWLAAVIDKLHAKDPAQRYQSAAEVAELLSKYLAHVQQPSVATLPAATPAPSPLRRRRAGVGGRRLAIAAAILFLLIGGISLTEATGVTELRATVIRIFTPDGVLVVETDDPGAKVTIEGDGGLVITGASLEEIRLRPGSYKVYADKDGKRVPLERELVSIARGGREVVKVKLEGIPAPTAAKTEKGAFVVLGGKGIAERKFDTLAEAVNGAADGDTIEVRGNGPFVTRPIDLRDQAVRIRAADGFRPVIQMGPEGAQTVDPILRTNASLVVEGVEFRRSGPPWRDVGWPRPSIIWSDGRSFHLANCRFLFDIQLFQNCAVTNAPETVVRNCEFLSPGSHSIHTILPPGGLYILENCLHAGRNAVVLVYNQSEEAGLDIRVKDNTVVSSEAAVQLAMMDPLPEKRLPHKPLSLNASGTIFDGPSALYFWQSDDFLTRRKLLEPNEAEAMTTQLLNWRDRGNLYAGGGVSIRWSHHSPHGPKSLADWKRFWGDSDSAASEGKVRFRGGDLVAKLATEAGTLTPEDFQLRPDSAGYRAGKDGKDLGADVSLVGPGPAYERWRKTPDYQQWLKDTGQPKK
jgi:hypothetical protein